MRSAAGNRRGLGLLVAALIGFAALPAQAQTQAQAPAQAGGGADEWIRKLGGLGTAPDLDPAALKQQAIDRIKARAKTDAAPLKRPLIAPDLLKLPQFSADIQFDEDAAVVQPGSYRTLGRIADTLYDPSLLGYKFLIVGHTLSTGKRDYNLTLSQRRADVIRDILVNTFKVSPKRLVTLGLGEEQMLDSARPSAPVNQQVQIATIGVLEVTPPAVAPAAAAPKAAPHKPKH